MTRSSELQGYQFTLGSSTLLIQSFNYRNVLVNFMLFSCRTQLDGFAVPARRVSERADRHVGAGSIMVMHFKIS